MSELDRLRERFDQYQFENDHMPLNKNESLLFDIIADFILDDSYRLPDAVSDLVKASEKVLAFYRGEGEYNLSKLPNEERNNAYWDNWYAIETELTEAFEAIKKVQP